ncbi:hypothetical protein GB928_002695 [Shinella curvata]|uniref:Uncharacterized protein n=1 Tax=Shinella curvata TaxID=1817964 RepID=A0ABT8X8P1_9HYPH|nr:hypothetical protein [Shinella curvata]MCJ8051964.1 hypothetical protein [Shinella curvata]MDO6120088.1 hypothetical protein [Shinella curvata]
MAAEDLVAYFRQRHGWKCRAGSAIFRDLSTFADEQRASSASVQDLYILFCVSHGMIPKDAPPGTTEGAQ